MNTLLSYQAEQITSICIKKFKAIFSQLVMDKKIQKEMIKNLKSFALPDATKNIIKEIKDIL